MFESVFLDSRRSEFFSSDGSGLIKKFVCVYTVDSDESLTEKEGEFTIKDFSISGNYLTWSLLFTESVGENYTMQKVRLYGVNSLSDSESELIAEYNLTLACNPSQTIQVVFKILYQEVVTSTEEES